MLALLFPARRRRGARPVRDTLSAESLEQRLALAAFTLNLQNWTGFQASEAELYVVGYSGTDPRGASNNPHPDIKPAAGENMYLDASTSGTFASNFYTKSSLQPVKVSAIANTITIDQTVTIAGGQLIFFLTPAGQTPPAITVNQPIWSGKNPTAGGPVNVVPGETTYNGSYLPPWDIVELTQITGSGANTGLTIDVSAVSQWGMPIQLKSAVADTNNQTIVGATMPASQSATAPFYRQDVVTAFSTFMSNANGSPGNYAGGSAFAGLPFGTATIGSQSYTFGIESPDNAIGPGNTDPGPSAPLQLVNYFDAPIDTLFSAATGSIAITNLPAETGTGGKPFSTTYTGTLRSDANGAYFLFSPPSDWAGDTSKFRVYSPRSSLFNAVNPSWQVFSNPGNGAFLTPYDDATGNPIPTSASFWSIASQTGNQINEAINRGVANLPGPGTATWSDQTKWYQQSQRSNLYAAFWHSATVGATPAGTPFMRAPTPSITLGNGFTGLGAYAFSLDENPAGLVQAQVPSKLNDIANGGNVTIDVTFGPWKSNSTVTVNAPLSFTVVENSQDNPFQWPAAPVPFADTAATALTVTLSVSGGTIAVNQQAASKIGLTVGTSSQGPTIAGPITALNTFFQTKSNVTYTPISNSLVTQTLTTSAVDALNNQALATSTIDIVSTAAPVVTAPAVFTVNENTPTSLIWPTSSVPFADASSSSLTVTLAVTGGSVAFNRSAATAAGLTLGSSPQGPTIAGSITKLNSYFQTSGNVTYTPITGSLVGQTLTTSAFDGSERGQATSAIKIIAPTPPTPGAPTVTLTPGVFTTAVNTSIGLLFTGTPFADTGATPTTVFTVTMSTGGPANGTLAATPGSGVTVVTSAAGATFTGTLSALNTYFTTAPAKITYSPPANVQGTRTLSTVIAGNGKTSLPASTTIVIGTNVAPTVAAPIAFWVPEQGRMNLVWPRGLQPFSDRDSRLLTVTLSTDSPASVGSFAASRADRNVTVVTTGDVVQLTGRPADLNRYFATAGRITYTAIGPSLQPRVLTVRASDGGGVGTAVSAILVRSRGPVGVPAINRSATLGSTPAGTPLVITYAQVVAATGATTANSRSVEFLLGGVSSGRLELWDGAKWIRVPAVLPKFKEPILAPGGLIRWTPPARVTGQRPAFRAIAWDGWKMSATQSQVSVDVT